MVEINHTAELIYDFLKTTFQILKITYRQCVKNRTERLDRCLIYSSVAAVPALAEDNHSNYQGRQPVCGPESAICKQFLFLTFHTRRSTNAVMRIKQINVTLN